MPRLYRGPTRCAMSKHQHLGSTAPADDRDGEMIPGRFRGVPPIRRRGRSRLCAPRSLLPIPACGPRRIGGLGIKRSGTGLRGSSGTRVTGAGSCR